MRRPDMYLLQACPGPGRFELTSSRPDGSFHDTAVLSHLRRLRTLDSDQFRIHMFLPDITEYVIGVQFVGIIINHHQVIATGRKSGLLHTFAFLQVVDQTGALLLAERLVDMDDNLDMMNIIHMNSPFFIQCN